MYTEPHKYMVDAVLELPCKPNRIKIRHRIAREKKVMFTWTDNRVNLSGGN